MSNIEYLAKEINSRYGNIKRARNCFLYTARGVRLTDMYQEGGRAILGWGGGSAFTMFKNVMNRGITGSFSTDYEKQTVRAVQTLFDSCRELFYFNSYESALKAAVQFSAAGTTVYKPWNPVYIEWKEQESIVFAPALPWSQSIYIVAVKPAVVQKALEDGKLISSNQNIPAPLHAAIARSIYDLIAALSERQEKHWFIYDKILTKYWKRKGPYLFPKVAKEKYSDFMLHCLNLGIVISPDYSVPSIVPFGADTGVFTALKNNPFEL